MKLARAGDNLRLLAPAEGVVTQRDAEPGSTVVAGQAVVQLVNPALLWVKVRFDQGRSAGLAAGLRAEFALRANPAQPWPGRHAWPRRQDRRGSGAGPRLGAPGRDCSALGGYAAGLDSGPRSGCAEGRRGAQRNSGVPEIPVLALRPSACLR